MSQGSSTVGIPVRDQALFRVTEDMDQRSALLWILERHFKSERPVDLRRLVHDLDAYTSAKHHEGFQQGREAAWSAI